MALYVRDKAFPRGIEAVESEVVVWKSREPTSGEPRLRAWHRDIGYGNSIAPDGRLDIDRLVCSFSDALG
jgi:hypothetical protein